MSAELKIQPQDNPKEGATPLQVPNPAAAPPTEPHAFVAPMQKKGAHELHSSLEAAKARLRMAAARRPGFRVPHPAQHGNQR